MSLLAEDTARLRYAACGVGPLWFGSAASVAIVTRQMCGIFGGAAELLCSNAAELLTHRGPNQQGQIEVQTDGGPLVMGATRLSVVSTQDVPTPMTLGDSVISFNGEIYNWREVRTELEALGRTFTTPTDTEVVLAAFQEWGPDCLHRFNGMFAIAIWHEGQLFLARDRLGKKPLFYIQRDRELAFSSELKALRYLDLDDVAICQALEFYFDEHTPFKDVKSVRPGEYLVFTPRNRRLESTRWWTFPEFAPTVQEPKAAVREFLELFEDSCRIRQVADVPVTIFLSGGIDSSLIQAIVKLDTAYTVQFEEFRDHINEQDLVREFADHLGFESRVVTPTKEDFLETFEALARCVEFPVGSFSVFPLYCLSRQVRKDGFVVALSGEGADELFNGYFRNELLLKENARLEEDFAGPYGTLCRRYFGSQLERFCRMASRGGPGDVPMLVRHFQELWDDEHRTFAQNLSVAEASVFLQPLLVMADRLSMGNSLEVRNPFLDYRLVEFSARLSDDLKFRDGQGKWLLRQALIELVGPDLGVTKRTIKHGLPAPVNQWLFRSNAFDRKDWNHVLLGECLKQLALMHKN